MKNTYPWTRYAVVLMLISATTFSSFAQAQGDEEVSGILTHSIEDDFENGKSKSTFQIQDLKTKKIRKLNFKDGKIPAKLMHAMTGSKIRMRGKRTDKSVTLNLAEDGGTEADLFEVTTYPTTAVKGTKSILAVQLDFMDKVGACTDEATIFKNILDANNPASTKNFYRTNSQNLMDLTGQVAKVKINISFANATTCTEDDRNKWAAMADEILNKAGYVTTNYDHRMYFIPPVSACNFAGNAYLGGGQYFTKDWSKSWIKLCRQKTIAHELGHNLGLMHSGSGVYGTSTWNAYGDHSDSMGSQSTNEELNAPHKFQMGWIPEEKIETISANGTYRVSPLNADSAAATYPQIYRIYKPDTKDYYYLSFRERSSYFDSTLLSTYSDRLNITKYKEALYEYTHFSNALGLGGSFTLPSTSFTVKNLSQTASYIEFTVSGGTTSTTDITKPTVSLSSPVTGATYAAGASVTASATASDNVGVSKVEFYVGGSLKSTDTVAPYSYTFSMPTSSSLSVYARAYDAAGNYTNSTTSDIKNPASTDLTKPTVSLSSPVNGATYAAGASVTASASASDNVGVTKVLFYVGGSLKSTDTVAPYSYTFSMPTSTSLSVYARAYDAAGNYTTSATSYIKNPASTDTTKPTVSLSSPVNGATYAVGTTVAVSASASDNVGVTKVNFYVGGSLKSTDTVAPYSYSFSMTTSSSLSVYARAYDAAGNYTTTATSYIKNPASTDTIKPTVSLSSPVNGATYAVGASVTASASASDNVGVTKVNFYVGGSLKKSDTAAPFSYSFSMPTSTSLSVHVRAYDAAGNYTSSAVSYIKNPASTSADVVKPSVSLTSPVGTVYYAAGTQFTATASASDDVSVKYVRFYQNGVLKCVDYTAPYSCGMGMLTITKFSLYARAYDSAGNYSTSTTSWVIKK